MAVVYRCVGILTVDVVFFWSPSVFHSQDSFPSTFRPRLWETSSGAVAVGVFAAELSNGYSENQIRRAMRANKNTKTESANKEPAKSRAFLQYIPRVTDRIGKLLKKHHIKTIYKPTQKLQDSLRSAKDSRDPKTCGGVYHIPCSCGNVYIGT